MGRSDMNGELRLLFSDGDLNMTVKVITIFQSYPKNYY